MVSVLVLAAGESSRMGKAKLLLPYDGMSLIRRTVSQACRVGGEVVVVLGRDPESHRAELEGLDVRIVVNPDYTAGMSTSLRTGVRQLSTASEAVLVVLADQPLIDERIMRTMIKAHELDPKKILMAGYPERRGNPVLFPRAFYEALLETEGDVGGREVIRNHPEAVITVSVADSPLDFDIDTPVDYEKLLHETGKNP